MAISSFASFMLDRSGRSGKVTEAELKDVASRLGAAVEMQGFSTSPVFGSSIDLWGFRVDLPSCEILVDVSPPEVTADGRWNGQVMLWDQGWFRATRAARLGQLKSVEWAVHKALLTDQICARGLVWLLGKGHIARRVPRPTP